MHSSLATQLSLDSDSDIARLDDAQYYHRGTSFGLGQFGIYLRKCSLIHHYLNYIIISILIENVVLLVHVKQFRIISDYQ